MSESVAPQGKSNKSVNKMRASVDGFCTAGVKGTSRDSSKAYSASILVNAASPAALKKVKEVFQLNENLVDGSVHFRGDYSSAMVEFKVNVTGKHDQQRFTNGVCCDLIAAIERAGEKYIEATPSRQTSERHTRGRRTSRF